MENYKENNIVKIGGRVVIEPEFSHELFEEKFYIFYIETNRLSEREEKILAEADAKEIIELGEDEINRVANDIYNKPLEKKIFI